MTILVILNRDMRISSAGLSGQVLTAFLTRQVPFILLAMGIFYLWAYLRSAQERGME